MFREWNGTEYRVDIDNCDAVLSVDNKPENVDAPSGQIDPDPVETMQRRDRCSLGIRRRHLDEGEAQGVVMPHGINIRFDYLNDLLASGAAGFSS